MVLQRDACSWLTRGARSLPSPRASTRAGYSRPTRPNPRHVDFGNGRGDLCRKLKPLLGKQADTLWAAYVSAETPDSKREAEALIQTLGLQCLGSSVSEEPILLPPPQPKTAAGEFHLGMVTYGATELFPLGLRQEDFTRHTSIFAITGGGKTNVAQILLLGLLRQGIPFLVVDWKRSYSR